MGRIKQHWQSRPYKHWRVIGVILLVCIVAVRYCAWTVVGHSNTQAATNRFNSITQADATELRKQFEVYADTLYSGRALFLTNQTVSRQDWTNFVDAQAITQRYPGINGISYIRVISRSQATDLTRELNAERLPSEKKPINIYPVSTNSQLAVITYLAPENLNQQAIGYDLFASSVRAQTLAAARDSGYAKVSPPISLGPNQQGSAPGLFIAMPIYNNSSGPTTTVAGRRAALASYVLLTLHTKPMLDAIFKAQVPYGGLAVTISDGQRIYQLGHPPSGQVLRRTVEVDAAGQTWQLDFSAPANFGLSTTDKLAPVALLVSAVVLAALIGLLLYYTMKWQGLQQHHREYHHSDLGTPHDHTDL